MAEEGKVRVCVIGAGPGGLMTLRALQSLDKSGSGEGVDGKYDVVCYERYSQVGGLWNFSGVDKVDKDGMEPHSSMYCNMLANNPKYFIECPDFLYPQNDPTLTGFECFPTFEYHLEYLQKFCNHFGLENHIRFQKWIEWVEFDEESGKFHVTVRDLSVVDGENVLEVFDYVIVATGHFSKPNLVSYPGEETFTGQVLHSKFFIDATRYKGKRVLLVGSSFSAEDLALQCVKVGGVEKVTISHRTNPIGFKFPPQIDQKPLLTEIKGSTVSFIDGTSSDYDVIIYCTGYLHSFPYMEESIRLNTINRFAPPLYKHVMLPSNPRVMYIGMQNLVYTFPMFWLQGHLCAQVIAGDLKVPSTDEMMADITARQDEESKLASLLAVCDFQTKYVNELSELLGKVCVDATETIRQWLNDRDEDITSYREKTHYKSKYR